MENVKYLSSKKTDEVIRSLGHTLYTTELYFKINHNIAEFIRNNTNSSKICVEIELDKDDIYEYSIAPKDDFELIRKSVIEAIEKISNEGDDEYFYNHILTDYGKEKKTTEFYSQIENEYGLKDENIKWWVSRFFISLSNLLFNPIDYYYDPFEE